MCCATRNVRHEAGAGILQVKKGRKPGDHNAKRMEIAGAACKAFLRLGIANAGLADIAREMGYTTGVLRHYFEDKEQLLLFAKNMLFDRAHERAISAAEDAAGWERLKVLVLDGLRLDQESLDRCRLACHVQRARSPRLGTPAGWLLWAVVVACTLHGCVAATEIGARRSRGLVEMHQWPNSARSQAVFIV
jgi:AcrR family transcriptional regulator